MTAIVLHDLGSRREARAWLTTAAHAAGESGGGDDLAAAVRHGFEPVGPLRIWLHG